MKANELVQLSNGNVSDDLAAVLRRFETSGASAAMVEIDSVVGAYSPRVGEQDYRYTNLLADVETELPPIVVHRATMQVIDGMYRLSAARLRGETHIRAEFFDGEEHDAFLLAVALNRQHGLPLSSADRLAAIERIIGSHPQWSDRALAAFVGTSTRKVSEIRRRLGVEQDGNGSRIGRDGRSRPLNMAARRQHASELIREDPSSSLRKIADLAGISPATVADVRDRIRRGVEPSALPEAEKEKCTPLGPSPKRVQRGIAPPMKEIVTSVEKLRRDPALRMSETGRTVLRALDAWAIAAQERHRIVENMPTHCVHSVAEVMYALSDLCQSFGDDLTQARRTSA